MDGPMPVRSPGVSVATDARESMGSSTARRPAARSCAAGTSPTGSSSPTRRQRSPRATDRARSACRL